MAQASEKTRGPGSSETTDGNEESHPRTKRKLHAASIKEESISSQESLTPVKLDQTGSNRTITEESGRKMESPVNKKPTGLRQGVVNKGASTSNPKEPPQAQVSNPGLHTVNTNPQGAASKGAAASRLLTKPKPPLASKPGVNLKPTHNPKLLQKAKLPTKPAPSLKSKSASAIVLTPEGKDAVGHSRELHSEVSLQVSKTNRTDLHQKLDRRLQSSNASVSISPVPPAHLKDTAASMSSKASPSSETQNPILSVSPIPSHAARKRPPTFAQKPAIPPKKPGLLQHSVSTGNIPNGRKEIGKGCLQVERKLETSGKKPVTAPRPFQGLKEKVLLQGNKAKQDGPPVTKPSTAPSSVKPMVPVEPKRWNSDARLQQKPAIPPKKPGLLQHSVSTGNIPNGRKEIGKGCLQVERKLETSGKKPVAAPRPFQGLKEKALLQGNIAKQNGPPVTKPSTAPSSVKPMVPVEPKRWNSDARLQQKPAIPPKKPGLLQHSVSTGNIPNGRKEIGKGCLQVERKLETIRKKPVAAPRPFQGLKEKPLLQAKQDGPPVTKPSTAPSSVKPMVPAEPKRQNSDTRLQSNNASVSISLVLPAHLKDTTASKSSKASPSSDTPPSQNPILSVSPIPSPAARKRPPTLAQKPAIPPKKPGLLQQSVSTGNIPSGRKEIGKVSLQVERKLETSENEGKKPVPAPRPAQDLKEKTLLQGNRARQEGPVPATKPKVQNSAGRRLHSNSSVSLPTTHLKDEAANRTLRASSTSESSLSQSPSPSAQNSVGTMEKTEEFLSTSLEDVKSTGPNQSQLEIAQHPLQRGELWCKLPEVIESGVLETLDKEEKKLQEVMFEFVSTEETYLRSLNVLIEHFVDDPGMNPNLPEGRSVLDKRQHHVIFSNVREVRDVSARFLEDLQKRQRESVVVKNISDIILEYAENHFHCYISYCSNQTYQTRELQDCIRRNKMFREYLKQLESDKRCQNLSMQSFLPLPMQRITRMSLLIQTILSNTPPDHPGHQMVENTLRAVQELVTACDDGAGQMKRIEELHYIYQRLDFVNMKSIPLVSENRQLEKKGTLIQLRVKGKPLAINKKSSRYFFVFTDYLIITKKRQDSPSRGGDVYKVADYASRSQIVVVDIECQPWVTFPENVPVANTETAAMATAVSTANVKNAFLVLLSDNAHHTSASYIFQAQNDTDKMEWIKSLIRREAIHEWDCPQVQAIYDYEAQQPDELGLMRGDVIKVYRKMVNGWYEGEKLQRGWFPSNYTVEIAKTSEHSSPTHALQTMDSPSADYPQVQAIYDYEAQKPDELGLLRGDVIKVYRKMADGWCEGKRLRDFRCGLFPSTYTVEMKEAHKRLSFPTRLTQHHYFQSTRRNSLPENKT